MGQGRDFLVGKDTPKGTMLINQAKLVGYSFTPKDTEQSPKV